MGKLAEALKRKYKTPREALKALGLDESLLDVEKMAYDAKRRARDGALFDDNDPEMKLARNLSGQAFETAQIKHDRELVDSMTDDDEDDDDDDDMVKDWRDEIGPTLEAMTEKHGRRATMDRFSRFLSDKGGWSNDQIHKMLKAWPLPRNATEGGMGGELAGDDEEEAASLAEDVDWTMKQLEGMGGTATSEYEDEPMMQSKDKRRRMARDARLARASFARMFPDAQRLDGSDMSHRYGDRLAMDAVADDDGSFDRFFPDAKRIGIAG